MARAWWRVQAGPVAQRSPGLGLWMAAIAGLGGLLGGVVTSVAGDAAASAAPVPAASANLTQPTTGHGHRYRHGAVPRRLHIARAAVVGGRLAEANSPIPGLLSYGGGLTKGGLVGAGVTVGQPRVYVVFYGSQWGTESLDPNNVASFSNDPDALAPALQALYAGFGTNGESWSRIEAQYCDGVAVGATACPGTAPHVPYPTPGVLAGVWYDNSAAATTTTAAGAAGHDLAAEAEAAAVVFGNNDQASNRNTQYVIVSPTGADPDGWLDPVSGYCAYHDDTSDPSITGGPAAGPIAAFTNMPYVPDAGFSCGAGSVNSPGVLDGATEAASHEYGETLTDQFPETNPPGGWTDVAGNEIGDKCAYLPPTSPGAAYNLLLATGSFAVQGMWSNLANGCVKGGALPAVTSVTPASGPGAGGTKVVVHGTLLKGASSVMFGSSAATSYTVNAAGTAITAFAPPEAAGTVDIVITTSGGTSVVNAADTYSFLAPSVTRVSPTHGPGAGGTKVVIHGTALKGAFSVMFGSSAATSYTVNSAGTAITAFAPPEAAGTVDIVVATPGGTSVVNAADTFSFMAPSVTRVSPTHGPVTGDTRVVIQGTALKGATSVTFGSTAATSYTVNTAGTAITVFAPPGTAGTVSIVVVTPGGTSVPVTADLFTYA